MKDNQDELDRLTFALYGYQDHNSQTQVTLDNNCISCLGNQGRDKVLSLLKLACIHY